MDLKRFWPPRKQQIAYQQRLLAMHRRIVHAYLLERAQWPASDIPLVLRTALRHVRQEMHMSKGLLRGWNIAILDEPTDADGDDNFAQDVAHQRTLLHIHRKHHAILEQRYMGSALAAIPPHILQEMDERHQAIEHILSMLRGWNVPDDSPIPPNDGFRQQT